MEQDWLAERVKEDGAHLRGVAYRMLGSLSEAEDAVQETFLRLARMDAVGIDNVRGWLTTVVARVCLDMLRTRKSRGEEALPDAAPERATPHPAEQEALLADSIGLAMLVVLEKLGPAERVAFVLHDLFDLPFEEIARIVGRSEEATRQLASRARKRIQGNQPPDETALTGQRRVVDAFLAAARSGDFQGLLAVLDPDVVARTDGLVGPRDQPREVRGAAEVAQRAVKAGARAARPAIIDGAVGAVIAPNGKLLLVLRFIVQNGKVVEIDAVGAPDRLERFDITLLPS